MQNGIIEAGCDEAGRGCLSGPVFAAAVILPSSFECETLNDSKQLSEKTRNELRRIIECESTAYAVASCTPKEIDKYNILWASVEAMHRAIAKLQLSPQHILVDGNRFKLYKGIDHTCVVKGDSKFMSIAAASILAKTYRDEYMIALQNEHPHYGWERNKGYPTREHRAAISKYGITAHHRKSFNLRFEYNK
ncbi:MAG: ribonuclease HII [Dysgonamonadaceae bacterium]|nr:ribonuclease HII [Dysgonamonadaceae bacterium]MDD4727925.1 ribonuclease HII [Dysgonamonadaceae bacterium]